MATISPFVPFSLRESIRLTIQWLRFLLGWRDRNRRFLPLSPPVLKEQRFFDRTTRKSIIVSIRDRIDYAVAKDVFTDRAYMPEFDRAPELEKFYRAAVEAGKTPLIIDCGANTGMTARYFKETYPAAQVVAVEPDASNMAMARRNNPSGDIDFQLAAIGSETGRVVIANPQAENWGYRTALSDSGGIEIVTVNELLERYPGTVPFIVKIDIEGFEDNLFARNTEWLARFPLVAMELHDWMLPRAANSRHFLREISKLDRDFLLRGQVVFSVANTLA